MLADTARPRSAVWLLEWGIWRLFVVWSYWAEIDQLTRAPGTVIASSKTKTVQSSEPGVVQSILVTEGTRVSAGQPVLVLERARSQSAVDEIEAELASLVAARSRLTAEINDTRSCSQRCSKSFRSSSATRGPSRRDGRSPLTTSCGLYRCPSRPLTTSSLYCVHWPSEATSSESEILRLERQGAELEGRYRNTRNGFYRDAAAELERVTSSIATLEQQLNQRQDRLDRTTVVAPVNGIVKNLSINTAGAVVGAGETLMEILPVDDRLVVEAKIAPSEIAFVRTGMDAVVKIDAYDYTIFGDLNWYPDLSQRRHTGRRR